MTESEPLELVRLELVKKFFLSLATDEHRGDVADTLIHYAKIFGLPEPWYCEEYETMRFEWNDEDDFEDEEHSLAECLENCR